MIDEKKLIEEIKKYHAGLKPKYASKLVDAEILDIIDIIEEQPKISLENKTRDNMNSSCGGQVWILVSERLPKAEDAYLVCTSDGDKFEEIKTDDDLPF